MPTDVTWAELRTACNAKAALDGEWAGALMPVEGIPLVVEPRYPYQMNGKYFGEKLHKDDPDDDPITVVNSWYSTPNSATVYICRDSKGLFHLMLPEYGGKRLEMWIQTLGASASWDFKAELTAMQTLREHLSEWAFQRYVLTGTFLETSKRSGVTYLFRKLRPTVAMRPTSDGKMRVLATLCLHPIAYFDGTWAGGMVPTDDVIAHLLLMRGDEHRFWKKSNHHPVWAASAGI
jgi:hypothetical protein